MSANPSKDLFIDTNIFVYAYDLSAGDKRQVASRLVGECWEMGTGCLSIQILQEFYVSVTKEIIFPLDYQTARQIVADLSNWRVHIPTERDVLQAIDLQQSYQLSFWDAMVLQSAIRLGCKQLLSEDLSHGQVYGGTRVINPFVGNSLYTTEL